MLPRYKRAWGLFALILALGCATGLVLYALSQNIDLFFTPTDVSEGLTPERNFRLGGMVVPGSVEYGEQLSVKFVLTDYQAHVPVEYSGLLPDLFSEGQGIVALGYLTPEHTFTAVEVLAKHDENYMPLAMKKRLSESEHVT